MGLAAKGAKATSRVRLRSPAGGTRFRIVLVESVLVSGVSGIAIANAITAARATSPRVRNAAL